MALKRSKFDTDFEVIPNQFYRTFDKRAFTPLVAHLPEGTKFVEPCAGYGDLINGLEQHGHSCVFASELIDRPEAPKQWTIMDALDLTAEHVSGADMIITNPPWKRNILHQLIEHFSSLKPTWLLFEADWAHTQQSARYMHLCTDIVSIGRMTWIEGTTTGGLKDCAWYRFAQDKDGPTRFWGRAPKIKA